MIAELRRNGVEVRKHVLVEKILTEEQDGKPVAVGVVANGREIRARAVLSNAHIKKHRLAAGRRRSPSGRLRGRSATGAEQHQFVPGLPRRQKGRNDPAHSAISSSPPTPRGFAAASWSISAPAVARFRSIPGHAARFGPVHDRRVAQREIRRLGRPQRRDYAAGTSNA